MELLREPVLDKGPHIKKEVNADYTWECYRRLQKGHIAKDCKNKSRYKTCSRQGHVARDCKQSGNGRLDSFRSRESFTKQTAQ